MKYFILLIGIFIGSYNLSCFAQNLDTITDTCVDRRVDSLFTANFNLITDILKYNQAQGDNNVDRRFVYMLTYMTGIDCYTSDYSGFCFFTKDELNKWKEWYCRNKQFIRWEDVTKVYDIFKKKTLRTEEDQKFLDGLLIE